MTESRTVVIVGATSGLGRQVALQTAARGHRVIAVGRDPQKAAALQKDLRRAPRPDGTDGTGSVSVSFAGDIATEAGCRRFAEAVAAESDHVDALINNAGLIARTRRVTDEGHELNLAVHHLAPFTVTSALLPLLRKGAMPGDPDGRHRPRVVNVNSVGHRASLHGHTNIAVDFDDLEAERDYDFALAYSRTKLANLLFTYELARRHGDRLLVNALHPGLVKSDIGREFPRLQVKAMQAFGGISPARAAPAVIRLAVDPVSGDGEYYDRTTRDDSSPQSHDRVAAARLWDVTEKLRGPFDPVG